MKTRYRHPRGVVLAAILVAVPAAAQPAAPERDVPPAPPVEALVAEALERSPSLAAARARLAAAREMVAPAGALPDPMVELMLQDVGFPRYTVGTEEMSMVGPEVRQALPYPGKRERRAATRRAGRRRRPRPTSSRSRAADRWRRGAHRCTPASTPSTGARSALGAAGELLDMLAATVGHALQRRRGGAGSGDQGPARGARGSTERGDDLAAERAVLVAALNRLLDQAGAARRWGESRRCRRSTCRRRRWEDAVAGRARRTSPCAAPPSRPPSGASRLARLDAQARLHHRGRPRRCAAASTRWSRCASASSCRSGRRSRQQPMIRAAEHELEMARAELRDAEATVRSEAARLRGRVGAGRASRSSATGEAILPADQRRGRRRARLLPDRPRRLLAPWSRTSACGSRPAAALARREADRFAAWAELRRAARRRRDGARRAPPEVGTMNRNAPRLEVRDEIASRLAVWSSCSSSPLRRWSAAAAAEHGAGQSTTARCTRPTSSDKPGDCPICGMRLVPIEEKTAPTTVAGVRLPDAPRGDARTGPGTLPEVRHEARARRRSRVRRPSRDVPCRCSRSSGPTIPTRAARSARGRSRPDGGPATGDAEQTVRRRRRHGRRSSSRRRGSGSPACRRRRPIAGGSRARSARSAPSWPDETRIRHVHTKIAGWVEKLYVNFTGQYVRAGRADPVDLLAGAAREPGGVPAGPRDRRAVRRLASSPRCARAARTWLAAARRRLELFDVPGGLHRRARAHRQGAAHGHADRPGLRLRHRQGRLRGPAGRARHGAVHDHRPLARSGSRPTFYEYEARAARGSGEEATVTLPYDAGAERSTGRVAFIYPTLDADSRTLQGALRVPQPRHWRSSPGCSPTSSSALDAGEGIVVPDSAVIDTGERQIVFVEHGRRAVRAARGHRRRPLAAARRQILCGPRGGRAGRDPGQLPARLRVAPARRHRRAWTGHAGHGKHGRRP